MSNLIDRDGLAGSVKDLIADYEEERTYSADFAAKIATDVLNNHILAAPTVDPQKHGEWNWKHRHRGGLRIRKAVNQQGEEITVQVDDRYEIDEPYCSECKKWNESEYLNFCPNCGAKMDGGEK